MHGSEAQIALKAEILSSGNANREGTINGDHDSDPGVAQRLDPGRTAN